MTEAATDLPGEWRELLDAIAAAFPLRERNGASLVLEWPAADETEAQSVQVRCVRLHGLVRLIVTANICATDRVSPTEVLTLSGQMMTGSIVSRGGVVYLRQLFTEKRMSRQSVFQAIPSLRDGAIEVRKRLSQGPSPTMTSLFGLEEVE